LTAFSLLHMDGKTCLEITCSSKGQGGDWKGAVRGNRSSCVKMHREIEGVSGLNSREVSVLRRQGEDLKKGKNKGEGSLAEKRKSSRNGEELQSWQPGGVQACQPSEQKKKKKKEPYLLLG